MNWKNMQIVLMGLLAVILCISVVKLGGIILEYKAGRDAYKELAQFVTVEEDEDDDKPKNPPKKEDELPDAVTESEKAETVKEDTTVYYGKSPTVNFKALQEQNSDIVAWIYAPGTVINYPIVQGADNEYYLDHMFNGAANDCGSIFMEALNQSDFSNTNTFIYGHHMKDGSMFASLLKYQKQSYYDTHPVMWIVTPEKSYKLEIFTGFHTTADTSIWKIEFATPEEQQTWLETVSKYSTFKSDVVPTTEDKIVSLSTCSSGYDAGRYVVMAVLREQ